MITLNSKLTDETAREMRLARLAAARLTSRTRLLRLAEEIFAGMSSANDTLMAASTQFVGEADEGTICGEPGGTPIPVQHNCSAEDPKQKSYDCPSNFKCDDKMKAFDCGDFDCGVAGDGGEKFDCTSEIDFGCGYDYNCHDGFVCSAGHGFQCNDDHKCDTFNCAATGKDEDPNYKCPAKYDIGGGDGTPGDFLCGESGGDDDAFSCTNTFDCTAKSDFNCNTSADFSCGDVDKTDGFDCKSQDRFDCYESSFECGRYGGKYTCSTGQKGYADNPYDPGLV